MPSVHLTEAVVQQQLDTAHSICLRASCSWRCFAWKSEPAASSIHPTEAEYGRAMLGC